MILVLGLYKLQKDLVREPGVEGRNRLSEALEIWRQKLCSEHLCTDYFISPDEEVACRCEIWTESRNNILFN